MSFGVACLLVTLLFVLLLVIGFFIGFWRGVKKSSLNLLLSVVALVLAFTFTPMITGAILDISISTSSGIQSINSFFISLITSDPSISQLVTNVPSLSALVTALPQALASVVMFMILVNVFEFVFYIIYKIFGAIFFSGDKKKENYKPHRVWGGVVGATKALILVMFAFMPITVLAKTANNIMVEQTSFVTAADAKTGVGLADLVPKEAKTWIKAYSNSPFGFVGTMFGLDNVMFDNLSEVKLNGERFLVRKEIPAAIDVYNIYAQINYASKNNTLDYSKINFEKIDEVYNEISTGGLFSVVTEFLGYYMENYKALDIIDYTKFGDLTAVFDSVASSLKDFEGGANEFFKGDVDKIYSSFKELASSGVLENVNFQGNILEAVKALTNQYLATTQSVLKNLFDMNIVRSGIVPIADKAINLIIKDAEKVVIDTSDWTQEKWEELSGQLLNISSTLHLVIDEIDFNVLLSDPMQLLGADKEFNIDNIFSGLGQIVDQLRKIEIFKNSAGQPIVDKLLSDAGFALPSAPVIDNNGDTLAITNYQQLFDFMLAPFKELKSLDIFTTLSNPSATQTEIFNLLANVCKTDANVLSNIILPLYQVEPTKTLLVNNLLSNLSSDLINFTVLNSYEDWKNDLSQISSLLVTLTDGKIGQQTYLEYILGGNTISDLILNLDENKLTEMFSPMLRAKSTKAMANGILDLSSDAINSLLGGGSSVTINKDATFALGNLNDQTTEVCNIFNSFMPIYKEFSSGKATIEDLNRISLGKLLDALKLNRYRGAYTAEKTQAGAFTEMFNAIIGRIESKYGAYISFKEPGDADYSNIDFASKMQQLDDILAQQP